MGSKPVIGAHGRRMTMAQKLRVAKPIPDNEFTQIAERVISRNKELLDMLAKV